MKQKYKWYQMGTGTPDRDEESPFLIVRADLKCDPISLLSRGEEAQEKEILAAAFEEEFATKIVNALNGEAG